MTFKTSLFAALLVASPALSQDLIGFDLSSFGKTVLSNNQAAGSDIMLEAAFGSYNNEFIATYSPKSVFAKMGRAVGRLDVATDAGVFPCTAFLVDDDLLMTNHHCVPGILDHDRAGATAIVGVQFVAGYLQEGIEEGSERFLVNPVPVETSKELDYTLLRILDSKPGKQYGTLALAGIDPDDNAPFWIIGHPMGEAQRISREKCRANAPALSKDRVLHTCDTLPGNSGSPVIDAGTQKVIALHHAGSARNSINYAVPMTAILRNSSVLKAAVSQVAPVPVKPDRDTQADRALARLFGLQDDTAFSAGLDKLIADFPGTPAARTARMRLDGLRRSQVAANDRAQVAKANEALLAALILTDTDAQRRALEEMLRTYGDTPPAAAAARATLTTLKRPKTAVPAVPPKPATQTRPVSTTGSTARFSEGTVLKISSLTVRNGPNATAAAVSTVFGQVTLGPYASNGWYEVDGKSGRFVHVPDDAQPVATSDATAKASGTLPPKSITTPTRMVEQTTNAANVYAPGSVLKVSQHSVYATPSTKADVKTRISGSIVLGKHVFDNWYKVQDRAREYVQVRSGLKILVSSSTDALTTTKTVTAKTSTAPTSMVEQTTNAAHVYAPGSVLMVSRHPVYDTPSALGVLKTRISGSIVLGTHVRGNWYTIQDRPSEYVPVRSGLKILVSSTGQAQTTAKTVTSTAPTSMVEQTTNAANVYAPGSVLKVSQHSVYGTPSTKAEVKIRISGSIVLGEHVFENWYKVQDRTREYVQVRSGLKILVSAASDKRTTVKTTAPLTATGRFYTDGTIVKIGMLSVRKKPIFYAPTVSSVFNQVKIGSHVKGDWYTIHGDSKKFVELPQGLMIISGGTTNK
ncbi:trypsin-like serine peptidase [Antarctobacter heliothermus]|uniref:Serine protease n=1 Tax=Antarctobacter heliothermus TaxID=74033 RepID=A0A239G3M0_9RHOB|nr:serine protease [Antarctobacter heliothermus]SNS63700.1 V8-like Glu-specific endopeptidase [Antarctobacter heliothermus]